MRFVVSRASQGPVSQGPPCRGAIKGPEAPAWPGEYTWYIELANLEELQRFLEDSGGALGVYSPEEGEELPEIEILDDTEDVDV